MLIAHLSDLHVFTSVKETALVRDDAVARVRRLIDDLARFRPAIDAVVISGDIADGGTDENYALALSLLEPLRMPVFVVPGNHDDRAGMRAAFQDRQPFAAGPFLNFAARLGPLRIIGLDSQVPGRPEGRLCPDRLAWLRGTLSDRHGGRTLIVMHHPPFRTGMGQVDANILVEGAEELAALIAMLPGPVSLLCGHVHRPIQTTWAGAFAATAASPSFIFDLVFDCPQDPPLSGEPYAYAIHASDGQGHFTFHTRYARLHD